MGIETEFGITTPGQAGMNSMLASSQVVNAYANQLPGRGSRARWDYDEETPLRDARGFDMTRADADPSQLTDLDLGMANAVLTNGARFYVDHAHPEYSSPEVLSARDAVLYDRAGELIATQAALMASQMPGAHEIRLYKNNTDGKGASYGTHENYLMSRATPFGSIVAGLIPFFVTRQVITGAGRVGRGQDGRHQGFQLSQRADFFEVEVGLETTLKRPIINTRDEPHADPSRYRRLHVIVGDANFAEIATYLKVGTTSLVLTLVEAEVDLSDLALRNPVSAMHAVSHDPTLDHKLELADGRRMTALELQATYAERVSNYLEQDVVELDAETVDILTRWVDVLDRLGRDPMLCARELDWVAKLQILEGYRRRDNLPWTDPRLALVDLQYADLTPGKGLARRLEASGRLERITSDKEVARAVDEPPIDTRAWFRGECIRRFPDNIAAASWDSVVFEVPGRASLQRVPTMEPLRGTRATIGEVLDQSQTVSELLTAISAR